MDMPGWHAGKLPEHMREAWFDSLGEESGGRLVLHFCMPHQVVRHRGKVNVNYTMFEATRVPSAWVREHRKHDIVIVPTESSRRAWLASGMPAQKLATCPLGIDPSVYCERLAPMELFLES